MNGMNYTTHDVNVNNLGYFLDGWADLVEGMGYKVNDVIHSVMTGLKERKMPDIRIDLTHGNISSLSEETRPYVITSTSPGATTAIYICPHGSDLYASWRTFIRPVLNQNVVYFIIGLSLFLGLIFGGIQQSGGYFGTQVQTSFSFSGFLIVSFLLLIMGVLIVGGVGRLWRGNFLWYFFIEANIFDAEDITAMSLSAHKTILRSLDSAGIDISKLRLKQNFKGGRRDETV